MSPQPGVDAVQSPQLPPPSPAAAEDDDDDGDLLVTMDKLDYHTATDPVTNEVCLFV